MSHFPDTSFLCALYRTQVHSPRADAYMKALKGPLRVSTLLLLEFRQSTRLVFHLRNEAPVQLRVFNAAGALVRTLVNASLAAGPHEAAWDGRDERGASVGSGVYYLQLLADGENIRQKVVRIR